ncbi:MAG: glycosyltransferase family 2 protein [Nitrospirae bacterium]|nr:glycosyltransferase family 2 protein [Nitrospirota bacterium]
MKVSLIITTYDSPGALEKVVEGILVQSRLPDEIIIADDGSDERTSSVVRRISEAASVPVFHVWQEHKGFRAARIRNEAIKRSSGDYLILLDGDCVVDRHFISDHLRLAEERCFVQGKRAHISKDAVEDFSHGHANSVRKMLGMVLRGHVSNIHHLIRFPSFPSIRNRKLKGIKSCNMGFFRRDVFAVNGFNEEFTSWGNEDSELACRFFQYGLTKKVHPFMAICFHLWHPTNKSMTDETRKLLEMSVAGKEYFCEHGLTKKG